ncbi:MAG: GtrA family protein [Erysipelotrichaceae bacterium]|nr:GtrA family protein [Erysipelotrichaceae bacterium]
MNKILSGSFVRFAASALGSCLVDFSVFQIMLLLTKDRFPAVYIMASTCVAKIASGLFNYVINKTLVFKNRKNDVSSVWKYLMLWATLMFLSGSIVGILYQMTGAPEVLLKAITDTLLFFFSYFIQKKLIFKQ